VEFIGMNAIIVNYRASGVSASNPRLRAEARVMNRQFFGAWSMKHVLFILHNYLWMPVKLRLRAMFYALIGVESTRTIIALYKKKKHTRG